MTITHKGRRVTFWANGRITVDDRYIQLAIRRTNGGHYTFLADDANAVTAPGFGEMVNRKLTGPRRPDGVYQSALAAEIVEAMF